MSEHPTQTTATGVNGTSVLLLHPNGHTMRAPGASWLCARGPSFTDAPAIRLDAPTAVGFRVDTTARTITGLVVPYGVVATSEGRQWRFSQGTLTWADPSRVKLWINHDPDRAVGVATALDDRPDGLYGTFRVARGPEGDHALSMAEDGVWDGFSVGIGLGGTFTQAEDGVYDAVSAPVMETSLTPAPAFDDARVHAVAASAATTKGTSMFTEAQRARLAELLARQGGQALSEAEATELSQLQAAATAAGVTVTAADHQPDQGQVSQGQAQAGTQVAGDQLAASVANAVAAAFSQLGVAPGGRQVVPAGRPTPGLQVTEEAPYRFDGTRGPHEFSTDLAAALGLGALNPSPNPEAYGRVMRFMADRLAPDPRNLAQLTERGPSFVTTTDTAAVNPAGYRPDMFVNEQRFTTPLYDAFYKGSLADATPFGFAKFNTATGLVGDHTQGTEPTPGTYSTATGTTITPAPVSGKVHITREVGDQGGNPQVSALIWDKITYEYRKAMENKVAAILAAAAPAEFPTALAAAANTVATLATPIEQAIARLNFQAGGNRYNYVATHLDLYLALAGLKDGQNRPYFPIIGPSNASGTTSNGYPSLNVSGTRFDPVWSIGTVSDGTPHKSYLADTSALYFWASAPVKLDRLQEKVEGWDLGVWGYQAGVLADPTGLLKITYDPV